MTKDGFLLCLIIAMLIFMLLAAKWLIYDDDD